MADSTHDEIVSQQYTVSLVMLSLLAIIFQPAFHFILRLLPDIPPDSLALRMVSAGVSAVLMIAVLVVPPLRRYAAGLQILNAATALIVVHQLVINSGSHPMYLAASLTAVYGAQLAFVRLDEWIFTASIVFVFYMIASLAQGAFTSPGGLVPPLFYAANYVVTTGLVAGRDRLQRRDLENQYELKSKNDQLETLTERLQNELVLARDIQQSLLPPATPSWSHFDVVCYSKPAREVGGDFYSYHTYGDGRVVLAVGDVSGKGVSAALLMATSLSLLNANLVSISQPSNLLAQLDTDLAPYTRPRNQNCALCYVDIKDSTLSMVNAGGVPPYVRRAGGGVEWHEVWGFALGQGLGAQVGYQPVTLRIDPGDIIVLVSDGVVEAKNGSGSMFSFERLEHAIRHGPATSAQAMVDHLVAELTAFVGHTEPHDDLTIAALRVNGHAARLN